MKKGDVVSVRCKTHGNRKLVAGADFLLDTPRSLVRCPYCKPTNEQKAPGFGFHDSKGVAYIYDWAGRLRVHSELNETEKQLIKNAKEKWISEARAIAFEKDSKRSYEG